MNRNQLKFKIPYCDEIRVMPDMAVISRTEKRHECTMFKKLNPKEKALLLMSLRKQIN